MIVRITISRRDARTWEYYLRRRYGKKRMGLERLIKIAVSQEVAAQAQKELDETGYHVPVKQVARAGEQEA